MLRAKWQHALHVNRGIGAYLIIHETSCSNFHVDVMLLCGSLGGRITMFTWTARSETVVVWIIKFKDVHGNCRGPFGRSDHNKELRWVDHGTDIARVGFDDSSLCTLATSVQASIVFVSACLLCTEKWVVDEDVPRWEAVGKRDREWVWGIYITSRIYGFINILYYITIDISS
jgi:hypothetical protein